MSKQKVLLIYLLCSIIWLFTTDFLIDYYITDKSVLTWIQKAKGLLFIFITGALIYILLSKNEKFSELKEEEQRLSTLINSMVDFVNFKDGEGRWIQANTFGLKLFQLENVNYKGLKDSELAEYTDFYNEALRYCEVSDEETWIEKEITRCEEIIPLPNGKQKTFDTIKVPLFNTDGSRKALVVIGRDITERVNAEKKLSDSQQQYRSLFEFNPDPVFMINLNNIITNINPQFENIIGLSQGELIGKSINQVISGTEQDEKRLRHSFAYVLKKKEGMNTGDIPFVTTSGKTVLLYCTLVPMLIDGEITGIIGYAKDVTLIRETAERLRKTEKLSVVGELAASVAHEVRNPLTSLKGFVQLLKDSEPTYQTYYSIMLNELDRINQIVSELLVLAKPQEKEFKKQNLVQLLSDVKALLEPQANYDGAQIVIDFKNEIPLISCDANQLKQVFINIIKNSIEASSQKVLISVQAEMDEVSIIMKDDGCGIEKDRIKNLGEPFYSSKEKGTGLGLTVTYRIIHAHRGKVEFNSEVSKGTEVKITLPVDVK
ncbi:PAS domain S-box-containing protein [Peribacillus deserti]|uniref:histidine kinase n=1 Tax=Peribacillus deserti TaxID=673318 RepID=A0ABS2QIE2_9BACI|nr:PAS domain-containing sensor histidine kinase [Peribacillus deserti]MBM7692790.1 PAS domain S-box-containing protein [Peribacillus deserti]